MRRFGILKFGFASLVFVGLIGFGFKQHIMSGLPEAFAAARSDSQELQCRLVPQIQELYLKRHVKWSKREKILGDQVAEQIVKKIDGGKIYLLQSDVNEIKKLLTGHFKKVENNDCRFMDAIYALFLKRAEERASFAKGRLESKTWALDPKTEVQFDAEKRQYPKSREEAEKFQDKYIQYQVATYLGTGSKLDEAKANVMKGYDRNLKQMKEKSPEDLLVDYLDASARALDPHSTYFGREGKEEFEIDMKLSLEGIGASLSWTDGFTVVEQLIDGGSAKKDGRIQPQDKIVAVGQFPKGTELKPDSQDVKVEMENVIEMPLKDVVRKIRGPKGTPVRLQVLRKKTDGNTETFFVSLVRDQIKLEDKAAAVQFIERSVKNQKRKVAVINLPSFYADSEPGGRSSANDIKNLVREAREKSADAMVLDLSGNGGGSLEDAVRIAGLFFRTGAVVKQKTRDSDDDGLLEDRDPNVEWDGPLVVLTSRISASASEIVAATLKDYKRAVVVGADHSFGKGTVQQVFPLSRFGMVKVTVGRFYTPGGFSTQWRGVEADVVLPGHFSSDDFGEKSLDYSLQPDKMTPFVSERAWVASGPGAWKRLEAPTLANLKQRSKQRVSRNEEFKKIMNEQAKAKKRGKVVQIGELLKEVKEKKTETDSKKNLSKEDQWVEYLRRADVQEAANVAIDLWASENQVKPQEVDKSILLAEAEIKAAKKSTEGVASVVRDTPKKASPSLEPSESPQN